MMTGNRFALRWDCIWKLTLWMTSDFTNTMTMRNVLIEKIFSPYYCTCSCYLWWSQKVTFAQIFQGRITFVSTIDATKGNTQPNTVLPIDNNSMIVYMSTEWVAQISSRCRWWNLSKLPQSIVVFNAYQLFVNHTYCLKESKGVLITSVTQFVWLSMEVTVYLQYW